MLINNYKSKKNKGFALLELLIVVACLVALVAVLAPVYISQMEKSRNAVDLYNAKTIADAVTLYLIDNEDALAALTEMCDVKGGVHHAQVSVGPTAVSMPPVLKPAFEQAGLNDVTCRSKMRWTGYRIAFTNYSGTMGKPGDLQVYYWGVPADEAYNRNTSLGAYKDKVDPTGFKAAMNGAS